MGKLTADDLLLFTTCPPSNTIERADYVKTVVDIVHWSEAAGCEGILVYTDNGLVCPWLVAQLIITNTRRLAPLIAVQPIYMQPYWAAKQVATLAHLHGRKVWLNMLAGGFKNDLASLGDDTPHDDRYLRTVEYTKVIQGLVDGGAFTFHGKYYKTEHLKLTPQIPKELRPGILISGSSEAGLAAAHAISAVAVQYPKPLEAHAASLVRKDVQYGIRVGILTREREDDAWRIAEQRFPVDRKGQIMHDLAMKVSDSHWHKQLSDLGKPSATGRTPYWMVPFENYKTYCPYLVGNHDTVAREIAGYLALGIKTFILDIPREPDDLFETRRVFARALEMLA